jgi:putative ABC transport system permease protein
VLGFDHSIGQELRLELNDWTGTIIGVVKDFHHASLLEEIRRTLMYATESYFYGNVFVRVSGNDLPATIEAISTTWESYFPNRPVEYSFYDDEYDAQYVEGPKTARIAGIVAKLAVFVACMGLFGLASFAAEQRTKETGAREVLGARLPRSLRSLPLVNRPCARLFLTR